MESCGSVLRTFAVAPAQDGPAIVNAQRRADAHVSAIFVVTRPRTTRYSTQLEGIPARYEQAAIMGSTVEVCLKLLSRTEQ